MAGWRTKTRPATVAAAKKCESRGNRMPMMRHYMAETPAPGQVESASPDKPGSAGLLERTPGAGPVTPYRPRPERKHVHGGLEGSDTTSMDRKAIGPSRQPVGGARTGSTYFVNPRREMLAYMPSSARRVLEAGCGAGEFGRLLRDARGCETWGIEHNPDAARAAAEVFDRVICSDLPAAVDGLPLGYFDCIYFNDVLEHLEHPDAILRRVAPSLAPHGRVVASVPNVRYIGNLYELLIHRDWRYRDDGILDRTHLRFFTEKSIRRMFKENGYEVLRLEGINPTRRVLFPIVNALALGTLADARFLQFACVATPRLTE